MQPKKLLISLSVSLISGSIGGFLLSFIAIRVLYLKDNPTGNYLDQFNYMMTSEYKTVPLLLMLFGILAVYLAFFTKKDYKTPKRQVAEGIETPIPSGEGQHGNARWLTEEEKNKSYPVALLKKTEVDEILTLVKEKGEHYEKLYS